MADILFLSWWWPYPANNGAKIRMYNLLRALSRAHQVRLLSFAEADEAQPDQIAHMRGFCAQVEVVPKPRFTPGAFKSMLGYLSRWPRLLVDVYSPALAAQVVSAVEQRRPHIIIACELQMLRYLDLAPDIPAVMEDAEITVLHDQVRSAAGPMSRLRAQLTLGKVENALRRLMQRGVALTVVSEAEQELIRRIAPQGALIAVIPNGVDTRLNQPDVSAEPQPHTLIYNGAVTYNANYDAVAYFIREVLPLVRQRAPQTTFRITGGTGSVDIRDLAAEPGVVFTGYLPSVAAAIQASWALVVPLRAGSGTRLKILEAMALGVPVVSTPKGAEGLHLTPGEDLLIADTPAELADAICRLFEDPGLHDRLSAAGRARVERDYDWEIIDSRLTDLIVQTLGRSR